MNIWLVTIGEPVPIEGNTQSTLHRTGYFAKLLTANGHSVTWWTSTFDHFVKVNWYDRDKTVELEKNLTIKLIHGGGYKKNVSLARMRDHRQISSKFRSYISEESVKPDLIVSAYPTVGLCSVALDFGEQHNIPVVIDMRDMWPDIFLEVLPKPVQPIARLLMASMFREAEKVCSRATSITGITDSFVKAGIKRGKRTPTKLDKSFALGKTQNVPAQRDRQQAEKYWDELGISVNQSDFIACFVGTIGMTFDIQSIVNAAKLLEKSNNKSIKFVVCGRGDRLENYMNQTKSLSNIIFPGWIDSASMYVLMQRAHVGMAPLPDREDFLSTINNKAIEYMCAGLPIISSPSHGMLADTLAAEKCGLSYEFGNAEKLSEIILKLDRNRALFGDLSINSIRLFNERFTAEKVYNDMMKHIELIADTYKAKELSS